MSANTKQSFQSWKRVTLGELLTVIRGVSYKKEQASDQPATDRLPILRATNIQDGLTFDSLVYVPRVNVSNEQLLHPGDIIIAASSGSRSVVGKAAQLTSDWSGSFGAFCFALRPKPGANPRFLAWFLQTSEYRNHVSELAAGVNINNLRAKHIEETVIPLPPVDEQGHIVAEIEKQFTRLEAGLAGLRRVQANLKRYRAAVLKAACEGKLVPTEACLRQAERGRQAELARQEGRALPAPRPGVFFVYAIRCDNDSIYIGHTQDLQKRWKEHLAGQGADWTSQHKPVLVVHYEECASREEAVAREKWLKTGFGRKWIRREIAAGRLPAEQAGARQAGYETGAQLLERILTERRQKWNGKGKYKDPAKSDTATLPVLPEGWSWVTAEQICDFITKGTTPHPDRLHSGRGAVQFLKVYNLTFTGQLDHHHKPVFVDRKTHDGELARSKVKSGDVLINIVGPPLGQVAVVPDEIAEANINQAIARFRPLNGVSNRFLSAVLQSKSVMDWAIRRAKTTAGQANLTLELCRELPLPLPPSAEQQRIVAEVERRSSVVEELEAIVNTNLQRATRLRQSILQRAFRGCL